MTDRIYDWDLHTIMTLLRAEELTPFERGKIYDNFMVKYNLNQTKAAELLGRNRRSFSRDYAIYKSGKDVSMEGVSDRLKWMLLKLDSKAKIEFLISIKEGLDSSEIEKLISILNRNKPVSEYKTFIDKQYKKRLKVYELVRGFLNKK